DIEPIQQLWEAAAACSTTQDKPLLLLGDLNGRVASSQVALFSALFPRTSEDETDNARGKDILDECDSLGLCILNGTQLETVSPGRCTSFQPKGSSVIDYAIVSEGLLPSIKQLHV
ncbi:hypothetical protein C8F01DRAFT_924217, partial [Mycena amicta]